MNVLKDEGILLRTRSLRLKNGIWGWSKKHEEVMGVGREWYILKGYLVRINIYQETQVSDRIIHTMQFRVLGRGLKLITEIIESANNKLAGDDKTNIYRIQNDKVELYKTQTRYNLSHVILSKEMERVVNNIKHFSNNRQYFRDNGFAWKYGLLMHGVPGTGKTKFIKCIAGELGWDILEIKSISDLSNLSRLDSDSKTVVVIEEMDKLLGLSKKKDDAEQKEDVSIASIGKGMVEGAYLTAIDGVTELDGVLIIGTTNKFELLNDAVYRDGRMDDVIKFDYITDYEFKQFFHKYYPNIHYPNEYKCCECTGSTLEKSKKLGLSASEFLEEFKKK